MDRVTRGVAEAVGKEPSPTIAVDTVCSPGSTETLYQRLASVSAGCVECGLCIDDCLFLQRQGTPKAIADSYDPFLKVCRSMAFHCSLCGLCTAVCPFSLDPAGMFLEMRREVVRSGNGHYHQHRPVLDYERRGTSRRYTCYCLPTDCNTVFFPGCALSGTRPRTVIRAYEILREAYPSLGVVLDCCINPSHDLGRQDYFDSMFGKMKAFLLAKGVSTVLVACPNCHKIFKEYGCELSVKTVYEVMAEERLVDSSFLSGTVTIHDPCAVRFEAGVQAAVRNLVTTKGLTVREMNHRGESTVCCGEGGSVALFSPDFAGRWKSLRSCEAGDTRIITYCAGCITMLGHRASHVLDLVSEPEAAVAGRTKPARTPITYWNRLRLKSDLQRNMDTITKAARMSPAMKPKESSPAGCPRFPGTSR